MSASSSHSKISLLLKLCASSLRSLIMLMLLVAGEMRTQAVELPVPTYEELLKRVSTRRWECILKPCAETVSSNWCARTMYLRPCFVRKCPTALCPIMYPMRRMLLATKYLSASLSLVCRCTVEEVPSLSDSVSKSSDL